MNLACLNNRDPASKQWPNPAWIFQDMEADAGRIAGFVKAVEDKKVAEAWGKDGMERIGGDISTDPEKPNQARDDVDRLYGPDAYRTVIARYVQNLFPGKDPMEMREQLIDDAVGRYHGLFYDAGGILDSFREEIGNLQAQRERAIYMISEQTRRELKKLKNEIEDEKKAQGKEVEIEGETPPLAMDKEHVPIIDPIAHGRVGIPIVTKMLSAEIPILEPVLDSVNIPVLSSALHSREWIEYKQAEEKIQKALRQYLEKLLESYMTKALYDSELGEGLRIGIMLKTEAQISQMFREGNAGKESLIQFEANLKEELKKYGSMDKHPGDLSVKDAQRLQNTAEVFDNDLIELINTGSSEKILWALDLRRVIDPEAWFDAVHKTAQALIRDVERNGNEKAFIGKMNDYIAKRNSKAAEQHGDPDKAIYRPVGNFKDAKAFFIRELVEVRAKAGAKEVFEMFESVNEEINRERASGLDSIENSAFRKMVFVEREMLIQGITIPPNDIDKAVINFVSKTNRADREAVLTDPRSRQELFRAIQAIDNESDDNPYWKYYEDHKPEEDEKMVSSKGDPEKRLTGHDRVARVKALLLLAKEARWIVKNFSTAESFSGANLEKNMDATRAEIHAPTLEFDNVKKLYQIGYTSIASRGGFNGKELGLSALKCIAGLTVVSSVLTAIKEKKLEAALTNPYLYAGIGTIYGIDKYREDPMVAKYLTASPGRKAEIATRVRLNSIAKKIGKDSLTDYIQTPSEWGIMRQIRSEDVKDLVTQAKEKAKGGKIPKITKMELQSVIPDEARAFWGNLSLDNESTDQIRFRFYAKFLTKETNVEQLEEHCRSWV